MVPDRHPVNLDECKNREGDEHLPSAPFEKLKQVVEAIPAFEHEPFLFDPGMSPRGEKKRQASEDGSGTREDVHAFIADPFQ